MSAVEPQLVVLLDEEGHDIGTCPKAEVHHRQTPLHLAFSCYVADPAGRLLLTRRAEDKATWPGVWTNSCCGHPAPGETLGAAVHRRVREELGLDVDPPRLLLPAFRYRAEMADGTVENEMCPVLLATCPDPATLRPDPAEVGQTEWVDWATFRDDVLASRREVSPWCVLQVAQLPARLPAGPPTAGDHSAGLPQAVRL
ncbi:MAG: isopentenyl-diphosphate Delta-isomerase [Nocardioides sp.]